MATELEKKKGKKRRCVLACTRTVKFMTDHELPPNIGISIPPYTKIDGYRFINIFVRFTQEEADEAPVDLGVIFAFSSNGNMGARRYVNMEANLSAPQSTSFISISGEGSWHGSQHKISSYMTRFPVMGPYVQVFVYNRAPVKRTVTVWGYLQS